MTGPHRKGSVFFVKNRGNPNATPLGSLTIPDAAPLPDNIQKLLNAPASKNPVSGAYQPQQ